MFSPNLLGALLGAVRKEPDTDVSSESIQAESFLLFPSGLHALYKVSLSLEIELLLP